jgi:hypothetical protein
MFRGGSPALGLLFIAVASVLLAGQGPVALRVPADVRAKIESVINAGRAPSMHKGADWPSPEPLWLLTGGGAASRARPKESARERSVVRC